MTDDKRAAERGRWAVAALFFVNGFFMGAWATQIPYLMPRHDILEFTLGLIILSVGIGAILAASFVGRLVNRFGSRRVSMIAGLVTGPILTLLILAPELWMVFPLAALFGITGVTMDTSMNANSVAVERKLGRAIMSSSHGFWSIGGFVGGIVGAFVVTRWGVTAHALLAGAASVAIMSVAAGFLMYDPPHPAPTEGAPRQRTFPRAPLLYLLGGMAMFSMVPEGAVLDWGAVYVGKGLGADAWTAGLAFALFSLTMAGIRFLGDSVRNRFGAVRTLRVSALLGASGLIVAALAPAPWVAIAGFALAGTGIANMVPILFSAAGNFPGVSPGAGIAIASLLGYSGMLLAPSTIGFVAQHVGFRQVFGVLGLILAVVAALAHQAAPADEIRKH